jgi:hypothetical protein
MNEGPVGRKEAIWLACRQKSCCHATVVPTGRDVWRIARTLQAPPWSFLLYFETPIPRRDAFALDGSGRRYRLALGRGPARGRRTPPPCIFLMRTRSGHHRCSLGGLRPDICRSFPSELIGQVLCVRQDAGCVGHAWSLTDLDLAEETALVQAREEGAAEYCTVVARWNATVAAAPAGVAFDFLDYCSFLLDAYDDLAAIGSAAVNAGTAGGAA